MNTPAIPVIVPNASNDPMQVDIAGVQKPLDQTGAVLLRGFDFTLKNFEIFSCRLCNDFHIPATRYARRQVDGDNNSTEVFRNNFTLLGHTEGSYKPYPRWPEICFFMCVIPPSEIGGETTIVDGAEFYKCLPDNLRQRFEKTGVMYEMYWEKERWQNEFEVDDVMALEALLMTLPAVRYTLHGDELHLYFTTQAITKDHQGNLVFATALLAHLPRITHPDYQHKNAYCKPSNRVYFGDGEELPDATVNMLIDIHDDLAYPHNWQIGDMLVLDNTRWLHGRTQTKNDCERVLFSRFGWPK